MTLISMLDLLKCPRSLLLPTSFSVVGNSISIGIGCSSVFSEPFATQSIENSSKLGTKNSYLIIGRYRQLKKMWLIVRP
jgi:hypothetical protein